jgi:hypothetical protein
MSSIAKTIYLSDIEPAPLNFRAPMGIETWLDLTYLDQAGAPWPTDLAAQLQLTGRTTRQTEAFALVATDVVNGRARAVLPFDTIQDPAGYRLRIFGTVNAQLALVAAGVVLPIPAVTPESIAPDVIDNIPLVMQRGIDTQLQIDLWADDAQTVEYDLAATTITAIVWADMSEAVQLAAFAVTQIDENTLLLTLAKEVVDTLPDICWWSLRAAYALGLTTLAQGSVSIAGVVPPPPPLVTFTSTWDYEKPDTGTPTAGQIVQQNFVRNVLRISTSDSSAVDATPTLSVLRTGDQITSGTLVWRVVSVAPVVADWYDVTVDPLDQLPAAGAHSFTFQRPLT